MSSTSSSKSSNSKTTSSAIPKSSGATMMSLGVFILVTLIFFSVRSYLIKGTSRFMTTFVYFGLTVISQYITNLMAMHVICKNWQYGVVFFITIIPWVLVFGIITLMLVFMPSWLIPFSNTFGFGAAKIAGINQMLNQIMINPQQIRENANRSPDGMSEDQRKMLDVLYFVTKDPSNIINELTCFASNSKRDPETGKEITDCKGNFEEVFSKLTNVVFKPNVDPKLKDKLRKMVEFKETVSEAIWYLLFGIYTVMITNMTIVNSGCNTSAAMMRKRYAEYKSELKQTKENEPKNKVYTHAS
jgi:hypothetical protein